MKNNQERVLLKPNINAKVTGRFIELRPISGSEINENYIKWLNSPSVNKYLEVRLVKQDKKKVVDYINSVRNRTLCEVFSVFLRQTNEHVGNITITNYNRYNKTAEFGIVIGEESARAVGVGAEAVILLLDLLFGFLGVRKVYAGVISDNRRSWKLFENIGLVREGVRREQHVLRGGKLADAYLYGLLKREWLKRRKRFNPILKYRKVKMLEVGRKFK